MAHARGKLYVDKTVQGALARRIVFHWLIFFGLSVLCLFGLEYFLGNPDLTVSGHLLAIWQKYAFFVLLMVTIVPSFVYDALKLSNRFAGPMVRLKDSMKRLADGEDIRELKFRDGDFWMEVTEDFNRMANHVRSAETKS